MRGLGLKLAFIMGGSVSCCIQYQMISRIKRAFMKHFFSLLEVVRWFVLL